MLRIVRKNLGVYFIILASLDFAFMAACAKILSEELSSIEIMFFRNVLGVFFMLYMIRKIKIHKEGGRLWLLIFRGVVGSLSLYLFFYNVSHISLGGAFAFQKTSPIFITLIAFFIFKESVGFKGWLGILIAFLGVLFIAQPWSSPELQVFDLKNCLLGILSGFLAALALTSVRELRAYYPTELIAFSFILIGTLMPLVSMMIGSFYAPASLDFLFAPFKMPSLAAWIFIIAMGILGTVYQIHITKAYGIAKQAGIVAGISYLDVVFSLIVGVILGDAWPSLLVFFGMTSIVLGGLILVIKKGKNNKKH